jgi:hypothetical protein
MAYRGRVSKQSIEYEERRLKIFASIYIVVLMLTILTSILWWHRLASFWSGKILWSVGSYLVFGSVLQIRYFDIKKISNPIFVDVHPGYYSKTWEIVERIFKHLWVVGSLLLFI